MESCEIKNCRLCNKEGFVFCDIYHEVIQKITNFIPNLININDESLSHVTKVCTLCYQSVKTIVFNVENIMDTQKILRIENSMRPKMIKEERHQIVEDITRKYTNIKVKKISICSTNSTSIEQNEVEEIKAEETPPKKLVVIEALPEAKTDSPPPKKNRALMCISCSQKFTNYDQLMTHLKTCNVSSSNLKCFCGKVFTSKKDLGLHVYSQHKQNKQNHVCTICQKVFSSLFNLQNHMASHSASKSTVKGTFMCHYCKGKFLNLESLKKHRELEKCGGGGGKKISEM